jgi:glycolate oxidase iron-sulfur subunit
MQTAIAAEFLATPEGREADAILRRCVHCGFCNATCPTYQLLGDELDGPRGRIYLVKQILEKASAVDAARMHLDRCLTCRSCETTCPSGVTYARLADIGRGLVESQTSRPTVERLMRALLRFALPRRVLFATLLKVGRLARPLLPKRLKAAIPALTPAGDWPAARHADRVLAFDGCVQAAIAPRINAALARVLDRAGTSLVSDPGVGCCGAIDWHLGAHQKARARMQHVIDVWCEALDRNIRAIAVTASGCAAMIKEYPQIFADDPRYASKAQRVADAVRDPAELIGVEIVAAWPKRATARIAFHAPCTLTHALKAASGPERLLAAAGYDLTPVRDAHLCCGSAGTYSILQPRIARALRRNKVAALEAASPDGIATANIGCLVHLAAGSARPVCHWIVLLDEAIDGMGSESRL